MVVCEGDLRAEGDFKAPTEQLRADTRSIEAEGEALDDRVIQIADTVAGDEFISAWLNAPPRFREHARRTIADSPLTPAG